MAGRLAVVAGNVNVNEHVSPAEEKSIRFSVKAFPGEREVAAYARANPGITEA